MTTTIFIAVLFAAALHASWNALVTALRETSIIFAMLIGVLALGERMSIVKAISAMTALGGAVLLRLAKG